MKNTFWAWAILLGGVSWANTAQAADDYSLRLEHDWRFSLEMAGDPQELSFDDTAWNTVDLPNNAQDISNELPRSVRPVWFRRRFSWPQRPSGTRAVLRVDAVRAAEVWLNGQQAGSATGGLSVVEQDVTDLLHEGENLLAIKAPVPGIAGGVRIFSLPAVNFRPDGLLIDTPDWQGGPATVRVRSLVGNDAATPQMLQVTAVVHDPQGTPISRFRSANVELAPGSVAEIACSSDPIPDPPLWSTKSPRICTVTAALLLDGQTVHRQELSFGFRWYRFDAEQGFFLNGERLALRGAVYIKTAPGPFTDRESLWKHEIGLLKGMGLNFVRPAEGGIADVFLDECDRHGLLTTLQVHDEGPRDVVDRNVRWDVYRNQSHPSLIAWHFNGEGKVAGVAQQQSYVARTLRALDPTRPVSCVELGWRSPGTVGLVDVDVAGQGNYTGWYEGTLDHIGPYMDSYRQLLIERYGHALPIFVSNYGAASDSSVHAAAPRRNDFSDEYFTRFHQRFARELAARPWMSGGLIFAFRDVQSAQPIPRHTWKGVIDIQERKKDAYYFYQSIWTDEPMVHIAQKSWTPRDIWPPSSQQRIEVFSNCARVELRHNGQSLGMQDRKQGFFWEVCLAEGQNVLQALGEASAVKAEDSVTIQARFRPPAPEPRLVRKGNELRLRWDAVPGVEDYCVFGSPKPGCDVESAVPIGTTADTSWTVDPAGPDLHYRVTARARGVAGLPSVEVGRAPGSIRWRFVNSGWFLASPALGDLDADGRLDIVIGSYNGRVYALTADGDLLWEFDTADTVFASAAIAPLRPGEPPSIVVNSSRALYVLSARGQVRWQHEGIRQYDRNTKSPAVGDLDGDGQAEVVVTSDTGEVLAFAADGHLLWRHATAGPQNAGLNIGTPTMVELPEGGRGVVFAADDGYLRLVNHEGQLVWKHAFGDSSQLVGPVPSHQFVAAGRLETNGVMRIASGMGGLQMLDLAGKVLWHRGDVHGVPSIARIGDHPTPCIALVAGPLLRVLDQEGKDVWQYQLERPQDFFTHSPVVADLDADGGPDLLVGSRATRLYALSGQGRLLWSFPTADELSSSPAVADLDHDGFAEVVLASRDGYLYVLGAGPVSPGAQRSLEYRANPARTGEYLGP